MAGQVSYVERNTNPLLDLDINCNGHLQVFEACRQANIKARLIFASSRFVYGKIDYNPVDEGHSFNCLSIYGIHKMAGENIIVFIMMHMTWRLSVCVLPIHLALDSKCTIANMG